MEKANESLKNFKQISPTTSEELDKMSFREQKQALLREKMELVKQYQKVLDYYTEKIERIRLCMAELQESENKYQEVLDPKCQVKQTIEIKNIQSMKADVTESVTLEDIEELEVPEKVDNKPMNTQGKKETP